MDVIKLIQFRAAHGEHRTALEDLNFDAHLKHVGGGAITTSACSALESIERTASEVPASMHA